MKLKISKFTALNNKLQSLLDEQSDLELILNPLISWEEKDREYKNWLDFKYAGREFDISRKWKDKVNVEKFKKSNADNWDEKILNDNEEKRKIFFKLFTRKEEIGKLIQKVIEELNPSINYDQMAEFFK